MRPYRRGDWPLRPGVDRAHRSSRRDADRRDPVERPRDPLRWRDRDPHGRSHRHRLPPRRSRANEPFHRRPPQAAPRRRHARRSETLGTTSELVGRSLLIVAHNARFDRPFFERVLSPIRNAPWARLMRDVPWTAHRWSMPSFGVSGAEARWRICHQSRTGSGGHGARPLVRSGVIWPRGGSSSLSWRRSTASNEAPEPCLGEGRAQRRQHPQRWNRCGSRSKPIREGGLCGIKHEFSDL